MRTQICDFQIRVLIYKEDGECVARALEMDLIAYGETEEKVFKELSELIECQITFAAQKKDDSLLIFPAEKEFFKRWEEAHSASLRSHIFGDRSIKVNAKAVVLTFSKEDIHELVRKGSKHVPEFSCA